MNCRNCQNVMNPQERFCSKCGTDSFADRVQPSVRAGPTNWDAHVKVLAILFIMSALFFVSLFLFPGIIGLGMAPRRFPFAGPLFTGFAVTFISIPVVNLIAGIGLLKYREWARILTLVLAAFMLIGFPFGTALGIYAFWVLLSHEGSASYKRASLSGERVWTYSKDARGNG